MGPRTVLYSVRELSRSTCNQFHLELALPTLEAYIAKIMKELQCITGFQYCIGGLNGSHVPRPRCPTSKYYEYCSYKGFESVLDFAQFTSDRKIIYADVGLPGVMGDSTLCKRSKLLKLMEDGT